MSGRTVRGNGISRYFRIAALPVLLVAALLAACTVPQVEPGAALAPQGDTGIVVLSVTRSGERGFNLLLMLDGPDGGLGSGIRLPAYAQSRDWTGVAGRKPTPPDQPEGKLLVLRLPGGQYRIEHWKGATTNGGMNGDGYEISSEPVVLSFRVRPGEVVYAGNIHFELPAKLNYTANLMHATLRILVDDRAERDLALLRSRYEVTAGQAIDTELVDFPKAGQPLRYYIYNYKAGDPLRRER